MAGGGRGLECLEVHSDIQIIIEAGKNAEKHLSRDAGRPSMANFNKGEWSLERILDSTHTNLK